MEVVVLIVGDIVIVDKVVFQYAFLAYPEQDVSMNAGINNRCDLRTN